MNDGVRAELGRLAQAGAIALVGGALLAITAVTLDSDGPQWIGAVGAVGGLMLVTAFCMAVAALWRLSSRLRVDQSAD